MAIDTHTTTTTSTSPLPAPLPSLKDAFTVRREIFGPVPSAEEQRDILHALLRGGHAPTSLGGWAIGGIVIGAVAAEWLMRFL